MSQSNGAVLEIAYVVKGAPGFEHMLDGMQAAHRAWDGKTEPMRAMADLAGEDPR